MAHTVYVYVNINIRSKLIGACETLHFSLFLMSNLSKPSLPFSDVDFFIISKGSLLRNILKLIDMFFNDDPLMRNGTALLTEQLYIIGTVLYCQFM